jgi:hypothetical protein
VRRTIGLLAVALLAGCTSYGATNSPVTKEIALAVPEVIGRWTSDFDPSPGQGDAEPICVAIEPAGTLTYRGLFGCTATPNGMIDLQFIRLDGELIAVTQPATSDVNLEGNNQVLLLYAFYRVRLQGDSLFVMVLDADSLRTYLSMRPTEMPFALLEGNGSRDGSGPDVLLTGTPEQLSTFLSTHARDTMLWGGDDGEIRFAPIK